MGRKIKGKKQNKIRDPYKQNLDKFMKIKNKINNPPTDPGEQHMPKSLLHLITLKEIAKKKKKMPRLSYKPDQPKADAATFKRIKGESDKSYLKRVNKICEEVEDENHFQKQFDVTVERSAKTGDITSISKGKDTLVELMIEKLKSDSKKKSDATPKLTKSQKRKLKLKQKEIEKKEQEKDEFEDLVETVKFGEVVDAPPSLSVPKKFPKATTVPRPGAKDLLLKNVLDKKECSKNVILPSGKRKDLPVGVRARLDEQQAFAVEAYRELKKRKHSKQNK